MAEFNTNCIKFSAITLDCATATPLKVIFRGWLTRSFHSKYKFMENS